MQPPTVYLARELTRDPAPDVSPPFIFCSSDCLEAWQHLRQRVLEIVRAPLPQLPACIHCYSCGGRIYRPQECAFHADECPTDEFAATFSAWWFCRVWKTFPQAAGHVDDDAWAMAGRVWLEWSDVDRRDGVALAETVRILRKTEAPE